jgi:hypothetical protein
MVLVYRFEPAATMNIESAKLRRPLDGQRFARRANHYRYRAEFDYLN